MATDYRLRDLWRQIDHLHLTYLQTDESPSKIEERKRLEGCIKEFLYVVCHDQKFFFHETSEVLRRTVDTKEDFSPYRAIAAWTAIAGYAHNLLAQPWRREFHEIKTYCGFYKHNLESNLVGAELMLEAMGYKHTDRSTMVLELPVDPDRVTMVSRDSLIALVECQIMRSVFSEVIKVVPSCTWREVLQFRETHASSVEQAVRGLTYRLQQRRYEEQQYRAQMESYGTASRYHHPHPHPHPQPHPMEQCPYAPRSHFTMPNPRYGLMEPHGPPMYQIKPHEMYGGGYYPVQNGYIPVPIPPPPLIPVMPNYTCSVPTAQLIELDPPHDPYTHRRSSSDHRADQDARRNGDRCPSDVYSRSTNSDDFAGRKNSKSREGDWDYVYQRLEEKKIGKKRDDLTLRKEKRPPSPLDLDEALKAFSLNDLHQIAFPEQRPMKINEALCKIKSDELDSRKKENRVSLYDNSSPPKSVSPKHTVNVTKEARRPEESKLLNIDTRKLRVKLNDMWDCVACTFQNSGSREVCEMCGKSRSKGGESKPLASGGRQCPKCTLVNEKGVTTCAACETSLKDSPTYI